MTLAELLQRILATEPLNFIIFILLCGVSIVVAIWVAHFACYLIKFALAMRRPRDLFDHEANLDDTQGHGLTCQRGCTFDRVWLMPDKLFSLSFRRHWEHDSKVDDDRRIDRELSNARFRQHAWWPKELDSGHNRDLFPMPLGSYVSQTATDIATMNGIKAAKAAPHWASGPPIYVLGSCPYRHPFLKLTWLNAVLTTVYLRDILL